MQETITHTVYNNSNILCAELQGEPLKRFMENVRMVSNTVARS